MGTISGLFAVLLLLTVASAQTLPRCPQFPDDVSVSTYRVILHHRTTLHCLCLVCMSASFFRSLAART